MDEQAKASLMKRLPNVRITSQGLGLRFWNQESSEYESEDGGYEEEDIPEPLLDDVSEKKAHEIGEKDDYFCIVTNGGVKSWSMGAHRNYPSTSKFPNNFIELDFGKNIFRTTTYTLLGQKNNLPRNWVVEGFHHDKWVVVDSRNNCEAIKDESVYKFQVQRSVDASKLRIRVTGPCESGKPILRIGMWKVQGTLYTK